MEVPRGASRVSNVDVDPASTHRGRLSRSFHHGKKHRFAAETAEFFHFPRKRGDTARRAYLDGAEGGGVGGDGKGGHDYVRVRLVRDV
jgi:hypothetical protein